MPLVPHVASGQIIASSWGNNVADQVVMRFTTAAQRTTQLPAPNPNQLTSRDDAPGVIEYWTGTAWVPVAGARQLAYTEITASKTVTATGEAAADAVVAAPATTFDGAPVIIEFFTPAAVVAAGAGSLLSFFLYQDGVSIGRIGAVQNNAAAALIGPMHVSRRMTPTAGSHSYTWAATQSGGNGTVAAGPGGVGQYLPAYLRITRAA